MGEIRISTTGTNASVVLTDLGKRTFDHPTVNYNLLQEFTEKSLRESESLRIAEEAGHVVITNGDGDIIAEPDKLINTHEHIPENVGLGNVDDIKQIPFTEKGEPNGVATLSQGGKIPASQLDISGALEYQGLWDANSNTPALASGVGTVNHWYKIRVAGSTIIDGKTDWEIGDQILFNGTEWEKIDNTDAVDSVAGRTGVVVLTKADVGLDQVENVPVVPLSTKAQANGVATLDESGKVPNSQLDLTSVNVYGARKVYGESLGEASTDSENWQDKLEIETPEDWPGGTVKLEWCSSWNLSNSFADAKLRVRQSGQVNVTRGDIFQSPSSSDSDQNIPFSGFKLFYLAPGAHTFKFQYSTNHPYYGCATLKIWNVSLYLKLVEVE
jgi:hypothetical protein